ncbi:hypothetical protein RJI07_03405 [Mycoplasmatota bacterium WC30]
MITASLIDIEINEKKANHVLYGTTSDAKSLVVIFPGGNNSCDRPILHYLRKHFLDQNFDVLCISYTNLVDETDPTEKQLDEIAFAINQAIMLVEKKKKYEKRIFITRSAGNIISAEMKIKYSYVVDKCVYMSPTSDALKYIDDYPGFIVSSTKDGYLTSDDITKLSKLSSDKAIMLKDGDHGLETTNILETIDFHKKVVSKIIEFIAK